ncbi:hypothetical protein ACWDAO_12610 [Streptomyces sp. NPDC001212]
MRQEIVGRLMARYGCTDRAPTAFHEASVGESDVAIDTRGREAEAADLRRMENR